MVMIMLTRVEHPESGDHYSLPRQPSQHSDDGRPPPLIILINPNQNYHQQPQPDQKTFPSHSGPTQHELLTQDGYKMAVDVTSNKFPDVFKCLQGFMIAHSKVCWGAAPVVI